jgi:hypothetical protein
MQSKAETDIKVIAPTVLPNYATKTWGRESAFLMLGILCYAIFKNNYEMVALIHLPILGYAGSMFGLNVYSKLQQFARITPTAAQGN